MILNKTLEKIFILVTHVYIFCTEKKYHVYHGITIKKIKYLKIIMFQLNLIKYGFYFFTYFSFETFCY